MMANKNIYKAKETKNKFTQPSTKLPYAQKNTNVSMI